ncbi:MAG: hypothetical protein V7K50_04380 [Nostoc sp.]
MVYIDSIVESTQPLPEADHVSRKSAYKVNPHYKQHLSGDVGGLGTFKK